jgi:cytoskeletal protein CcmA (bactofilin family)
MKKTNATTPPLLSYTESTNPSPLEVSTVTPTSGQIIFDVASNANVLCKQIVISVPIGNLDIEVYSTPPTPTASINSSDWSISTQILSGEGLGYISGINYTVFTLNNNTAGYAVNTSFRLTITGNVNTIISSNAQVELAENSSPVVKPNYTVKSATYTVVKAAPPAFYVNNFMSSLPGTPTVPETEFTNGAAFLLSWESNGSFYKIYQQNQTSPVYSGSATSFQVGAGMSTDTTFILVATQGDATLYGSLTLTVTNPDITPKTVVSSGNVTVGSDLSVMGTIASSGDVTVGTNLTVDGAFSVAGTIMTDSTHIIYNSKEAVIDWGNNNTGNLHLRTLAQQGNIGNYKEVVSISQNGDINNMGDVNCAGNMAICGNATVNGQLAAGALNVGGNLTANSGHVSLMGGGTLLAQGVNIPQANLYANTDGFAVAFINCVNDYITAMSYNYAYFWVAGNWLSAQGGNVAQFGPWLG